MNIEEQNEILDKLRDFFISEYNVYDPKYFPASYFIELWNKNDGMNILEIFSRDASSKIEIVEQPEDLLDEAPIAYTIKFDHPELGVQYVKFTGTYSSWDSPNWNKLYLAKPVTRMVTFYEKFDKTEG